MLFSYCKKDSSEIHGVYLSKIFKQYSILDKLKMYQRQEGNTVGGTLVVLKDSTY